MTHIPTHLYQQIIKNVPILCVDVAIRHDRKLLLIKRLQPPLQGEWWVPGGRVFVGEKLEDAARRKLKDETNLVAQKLKQINAYETMFDKSSTEFGDGLHAPHTVNVLFLADVEDITTLRLDSSSGAYQLFDHVDEHWHPILKQMIKDCNLLITTRYFFLNKWLLSTFRVFQKMANKTLNVFK